MVWLAGWRPTSCAIATVVAGCRPGATTPKARRAGRRRCGSRCGTTPAPVSLARSIAGPQGADRARPVSHPARPVFAAGRHGVLRPDLDLFRGRRAARLGRPWSQPRRQAAQPVGSGRSRHMCGSARFRGSPRATSRCLGNAWRLTAIFVDLPE